MNQLIGIARRIGARRAISGAFSAAAIAVLAAQPATAQSARETAMERRMEALENELKSLRKQVRADRETAAKSAGKPKKIVSSGNDRVSVSVSGQINRAVAVISDGNTIAVRHVDNDNSSTRFRIKAKAKVSDDFSIGGRIEMEVQSNPSDSDSISATDQTSGATTPALRQAWIAFSSKSLGKLTIGHGSVATDGIAESDLSGTSVIANSEGEDFAGSGFSTIRMDNGASTGFEPNDSFNNYDGGGRGADRMDMIRYDSPKFMGGQISVSRGSDDGVAAGSPMTDVALRYSGKVPDFKIKAGAGFVHRDSFQKTGGGSNAENMILGSVSALHVPTGLSVSYSQGQLFGPGAVAGRGVGAEAPSFWYAKAGWQANLIPHVGMTYFAVDYGEYDEQGRRGDFGAMYGVYVVQKVDKASTELYAGFRVFDYDGLAGVEEESIKASMIGVRVKF